MRSWSDYTTRAHKPIRIEGARIIYPDQRHYMRSLFFVVSIIAIVALAITTAFDKPVAWNWGPSDASLSGCGNDGTAYCNMALGRKAPTPYRRRILTPLLVSLMPNTVLASARFRIFNLICLAILASLTVVLTRRIVKNDGINPRRIKWGSLLAVPLIFLLPQLGLRWTIFYPALVDPLANTIGLTWLILLTDKRRWVSCLAPAAAFLTGIAREQWIPVGMAACAVMLIRDHSKKGSLGAGVFNLAGFFLSLILITFVDQDPNSINSWEIQFTRGLELFREHFFTAIGLQSVLWQTIFALGVFPLFVISWRFIKINAKPPPSKLTSLELYAIIIIAGHWLLAVIGTNDMHRIISSGAPCMIALVLAKAIRNPKWEGDFTWAILISTVLWNPGPPFLDGSLDNYHLIFSPVFLEGQLPLRFQRDLLRLLALTTLWIILKSKPMLVLSRDRGAP